jgi:hypothetical protein
MCRITESETNQSRNLTFYVIDTNQPGLLGLRAAQELGLIKSWKIQETSENLHWFGCLEREYHIKVDPKVTPVINPSRIIPAALRSRVKEEFNDMEQITEKITDYRKNVIRKVEEPIDWVSSMVVVEKPNGKLRICLESKHLNTAIKRERFHLTTIEDITTRMANARWFSKLDANHGY